MANFFGTPYSSPIEIYDALVEQSEESWILGLLAYSILEESKFEWMKHHKLHHGNYPDENQIQEWYKQQPKSALMKARDEAFVKLKDYADDVVTDEIEYQKQEFQSSILVQEIQSTKKFWPQFGVNLAGGLISSFLFSLMLTALAFIIFNDASPISIASNSGIEINQPSKTPSITSIKPSQ